MKHNSIARLRSIPPIRRTLSALFLVLSLVTAVAAVVDTSWTYQGQLRRGGAPHNGTCNFQFELWNTALGGTQQGNTLSINGVNVANGLFTVVLDFGDLFNGDAFWLATSVQCTGDPGFTPLEPRQPLTGAPYALSLRPGARIEGFTNLEPVLSATNAGPGFGIIGSGKIGLYGSTTLTDGAGVYGQGGSAANSAGVFGLNTNSAAIWGRTTGTGSAIFGENTSNGLAGRFVGPVDMTGALTVTPTLTVTGALTATNTSSGGTGVVGTGRIGVYGETSSVEGTAAGVLGRSTAEGPTGAPAVLGRSTGHGPGIYGENTGSGNAGEFHGDVSVSGNGFFTGNLTVIGNVLKGSGDFRIDHPLDPEHKFLSHSFVESPDMMNIYNGNVTTDATGNAAVPLPAYFEALNRDFRYQLTVLGQFAQAIVSRKIAGNSFEIRTDKPSVEVSWQVTGIRQDAWARARPIVVEEFKPAEQQGMYLYPAGFGAGEEKQIGAPSRPATPQTEQKITK